MNLFRQIIGIKNKKKLKNEPPLPLTSLNSEEAISGMLMRRFQIVDVRTPKEYESHHLPDSILMPIQELETRYAELEPSRETLVVCERGVRSQKACCFLSEMGFKRLYNLNGGLSNYKGPKEGKSLKLKMKIYFRKIFRS